MTQERVIERFIDYIKINSESRNELAMAQRLVKDLTALGADVTIDETTHLTGSNTGNVIAKFKGNCDKPPILLCAHMDTVTPGIDIKPVIENGIIRSSGDTILGADDKAGITAIISAIEDIKENHLDHGDIEVAFTVYEEGGLHGAKHMDLSGFKSKWAFVFDSSGAPGEIIVKAPAQNKLFVTIIGKAAHAGVNPEAGISAIQVAARAINNMQLLRIDEETTANIGVISGGSATNIVCPEVVIKGEIRSHNPEKLKNQTAHMQRCFEEAVAYYAADAHITLEESYGSFCKADDHDLVLYAERVFSHLGYDVKKIATGGGSDTNIFNARGLDAVNLGVGMMSAHSLKEHIEIVNLMKAVEMAKGLILSL